MQNKKTLSIFIILICTTFSGVLGSWGYILPYLASYLRIYNKSVTISKTNWAFYMTLVGDILAVKYFEKGIQYFGLKGLFRISL